MYVHSKEVTEKPKSKGDLKRRRYQVCVSVGRERGDTARTMGVHSDCGCLLWTGVHELQKSSPEYKVVSEYRD